jgi:hypothetical protein
LGIRFLLLAIRLERTESGRARFLADIVGQSMHRFVLSLINGAIASEPGFARGDRGASTLAFRFAHGLDAGMGAGFLEANSSLLVELVLASGRARERGKGQ